MRLLEVKEKTLNNHLYTYLGDRNINVNDSPENLYYKLLYYEKHKSRIPEKDGDNWYVWHPNGTRVKTEDHHNVRLDFEL
jgi:hypothetical protein